MKKLLSVLVISLLAVSSAQAITLTSDINTDLGDIATGEAITLNLTASDYEAEKPSGITWFIKLDEGSNPGLKLDRRRGESVKLSAPALARRGNDGRFVLTVTANDAKAEGSITIRGRVVNKPVIKTERLADVHAMGEKRYLQRIDMNSGIEPIRFTISGDFPEGLTFGEAESQGNKRHVITGETNQLGTYTFTLIASNNVGTDSKEYTLNVQPVRAKIKAPKDFPKEYVVQTGIPFYIDLKDFAFSGTRPLEIATDEKSQNLGIEYDAEKKAITGNIPAGTKTRRHSVKLSSMNDYGNASSITFTLNIQSLPYGIKLTPPNNKLQKFTEGSTDIYAMPLNLGRPVSMKFKADSGTKPITWDYVIVSMDESLNGKKIVHDLSGDLGGLKFAPDGSVTGAALYGGHVIFTAEASNSAGSVQSEPYDFVFGRAPSFDIGKTSSVVALRPGQSVNINPLDYLAPVYSGRFDADIKISGNFPKGLSFDGKNITGTVIASSVNDLKKYTLYTSANSAFGTSRGKIVLELQDAPRIGNVPEVITGKKGNAFRYTIPVQAKKPYTWRMEFNGKDVIDEIGDSGIDWKPKTGSIYGSSSKMLEGTYQVTAYIMNDVGQDSRTFTIRIDE